MQQFVRGFVTIEGTLFEAIRFSSGIVHVMKSRRGSRVSKRIAKTFFEITEYEGK